MTPLDGPPFRIRWRDEPSSRTVWIEGEVDQAVAAQLRQAFACEQDLLRVDLDQVTFIDVSGLTCLIDATESHRVTLIRTSPRVDRLLEITLAREIFDGPGPRTRIVP